MENRWSIEKHLLQSEKLPLTIEKKVSEEIVLYGHYDLDKNLLFKKHWIVLSAKNLWLFEEETSKNLAIIPLESISRTVTSRKGSFEELKFLTADDCAPIAKLHYTGKQKAMIGQIKWFVDEFIKGADQPSWNICPHEIYKTNALASLKEVQAESSAKSNNTLFRLLGYLKPYKSYVAIGSAGAVIATGLALLPPYLSGMLVDDLIRPFQSGELKASQALASAWPLVAMLGGSYVLREIFSWMRLNRMSLMGEFVARDLRDELYSHLQELDMDYFSKKPTGGLISRVSSDTDRIWDFIAFGVVEVSISTLTLLALCGTLISLDWRLGLVMTIPVPLLLWSIYSHGERMKALFTKCWRKWSDLTGILSDTIPGMQVVKAFSQQDREKARFNNVNERATSQFESVHHAWTSFWPMLMMSIHVIVIIAWAIAVPRLFSSEDQLSVGTFVSFLLYMTMFSAPIEVIGQMARMMNKAVSSAHRIFEVLDTNAKISSPENGIKLEDLKGNITFNNVAFSYDGVRPILKNVSFEIKSGEMIGLVGSSGGGKSTITKLVSRFYDTDKGEILIDGHNLKELDLELYRKSVGMVLQEPYLFHGTLWENIAYGLPNVSKGEVIEAARVANAHDFIMGLPNAYETVIGERGHTLSGGERQRVSIARAILHDPKILILDEATSAVDTETERKIQEALDRLTEGRTVIAVAHRLSTLRAADRIFVINKGDIVESGTHKELLSKDDGEYYKLHKMQKDMNANFAL
jgi:ATP-binding cassette subfamily B protein